MTPAVVGGAAAVAGVLLLRAWWSKGRRRFARVADGVYRSGAFPPARLPDTVRRFGLRTIVDFRRPSPAVDGEARQLAGLGVRHVHIPIGQTLDEPSIERFLDVMRQAERPVLIHCKHGAGRTPLFAALYLTEVLGWDEPAALRRCFWPSLRMFGGFRLLRREGLLAAARHAAAGEARRLRQSAVRRPDRARVRLSWHKKVLSAGLLLLAAAWGAGSLDRALLLPGLLLLLLAVAWSIVCSGYPRPGEDFVPDGPFRLARHPEAYATLLAAAGGLLATSLGWPARGVLFTLLLVATAAGVHHEDGKLRRRLLPHHADWLASTRALRPSFARARGAAAAGGFDWSRVRRAGGRASALWLLLAVAAAWVRLELSAGAAGPPARLRIATGFVLAAVAFGTGFVVARARAARQPRRPSPAD